MKIIQKQTRILKLLSDETRFRIISLLDEKKELCVQEIAEKISLSQSATSHQLSKLENNNIVSCTRMGQHMCYTLKDSKETKIIKSIINITKKYEK